MDSEMHWFAIVTYNRDALRIRQLALDEGLDCFVPMMYVTDADPKSGQLPKEAFRPVVQNYVFVRTTTERLYDNPSQQGKVWPRLRLGKGADETVCHIFHLNDSMQPAIIPDKHIDDCRRLSDPEFRGSVFITFDDKATRLQTEGRAIRMTRGRFKGLEGTLAYGKNHARIFQLRLGNICYRVTVRPWMYEFI